MAMHSFMARLIVEAGRLPASYESYYPVRDFGSFAAGFPAIAAVLTVLSGAPAHRTSLVVALLTYPALAAALFLVARRFAAEPAALAAAVFVATVKGGYAFLSWGGNPSILALALGVASIAPLVGDDREQSAERTFPILVAGATLVHVIPVLGLAYATPLAVLGWIMAQDRGRIGRIGRLLALTAVAAAMIAIVYATGTRPEVSAREVEFTRWWQREMPHAYRGTAANFAVTIWPYAGRMLGGNWVAAALAGVAGALVARGRRQLPWIVFALVALLLVLNSRYWVLPGSPGLYPERMVLLLLVPAAAMLAAALETARGALAARRPSLRPAGAVMLVALAAFGAWSAARRVRGSGNAVFVTADDLAALSWVERNVPAGEPVANRYGDAGVWIPAIAGHAVTRPHLNLFYADEIEAWGRTVEPRFAYRGARSPLGVDEEPPSADALRAQPERWREVFARGGASVFERVR
jgi:hypothetical protein